jgi:type II secretory pathway pseudopilin PulG
MKHRERGLSLVEILVAIVILLLGIVPLMRLMMFSLRTGNRAHVRTVATDLARGMGEEIRMKAFAEEFIEDFPGDRDVLYPNTDTPQSFGLDGTETAFSVGDGRFFAFDDVDDYNQWCRGPACDCTGVIPAALCDTSPIETYDGNKYDGTKGFPAYPQYTRKVHVFNVNVDAANIGTYRKAPFENLSGMYIYINRFDFEESNFSNITSDAAGLSPLKIIEVTVTYHGVRVADSREAQEVKDVSMAVMPILEMEEE